MALLWDDHKIEPQGSPGVAASVQTLPTRAFAVGFALTRADWRVALQDGVWLLRLRHKREGGLWLAPWITHSGKQPPRRDDMQAAL